MKITDLQEDGRIVKGVNTTVDVDTNSISKETAKFGNKVDKDGRPPVINSKAAKNSTPHKLHNLGLAESKFTAMELAIMEGGHSLQDYKLVEIDMTIQQKSTRVLLSFLKKLTDAPMDKLLAAAVRKELAKRGVKTESKVTEIKAVTNIDPNQVEKEDFDDHIGHTKKVGKVKGYEIHTAESNPHIALKYHHFLVKDPESEGFLGELKLGAFQNYWVSEVWFTPEIQGKGLALPLYVLAIKKGYDLVSDREQSKGSQAIWKNLTKVPGIFVYAWDRKYDEFFQWDPDEDLDSEVYYRQEKMDKIEADYKTKWAELNDKFDADEIDQEEYNRQFALLKDQYKKAEEELSQVKRFSDVRLVAIDEKKPVKENLESTAGITDAWFKDGFKTFKKPAKEKYEIADADGTVKTLEGPVSYKKGYYIMTGPKGEQYPMPPEKFRELKDDHGNGVASSKKIIKTAKLADHDGSVNTSWGATLEYRNGQDYIVRHGANDYGVVKADIFQKTYDTSKANESLEEITRRNFLLKGLTAAGVAAATGAKVNVAKAADATSKFDPNTLQPGEKYYKIVIKLPEKQIVKYHRLTDFKDIHEVNKVYLDLVSKHGLGSHDLDVYRMTRSGKTNENFADGEEKGKSRPGRVARAGASCKGSVTDLRKRAKKYSGEKAKMYHWCANMKSGRKKG